MPSPNAAQANATVNCVADCDQGSGTAADIKAYVECRDDCINEHYYANGGTPDATGAADSDADATATGVNASPSNSDDASSTTNDDSNSTDQPGAASATVVMSSSLGLFVALAAAFAL